MKKNRNAWKRFHDPDATEGDYQRWREEHRQRVWARAVALMSGVIPAQGSASSIAKAHGTTSGTVSRYRNGRAGKRGPLLATYLMMRGR